MKSALFRYLMGSVRFEAIGGQPEKFLDACRALGIPLQNITATAMGFSATLPARCYRRCHRPARRFRCVLHVTQKYGAGFTLRAFRGRWGILLGAALAYALCFLFAQFVWCISYVNCTPAQQQFLSDALYKYGICEGTFYNNDDIRYAERYILTESDDFAWLSFNFVAGKLVVESNTREQPPQLLDRASTDIIATQNATIYKIHLVGGYLRKQVGQSVAEGEVLVEGGRWGINGRMLYTRAEAEVWANLEKSYLITQPFTYTADVPQSAATQAVRLCFAWGSIPLKNAAAGSTPYWQAEEHEALSLFGLTLPCTVQRTVLRGNTQAQITLTDEEALQLARCKLYDAILQDLGSDCTLLQKAEEVTETENGITLTLHITANAQIGKNVPHVDTPAPVTEKN